MKKVHHNKQRVTKRFHLILDAAGVNKKFLTNHSFLKRTMREISILIRMKILYGPVTVKSPITKNAGLSSFCIIDYSHISIHTFTNTKEMRIDIFSCKPFRRFKLKRFLIEKFQLHEKQIFITNVTYDKK